MLELARLLLGVDKFATCGVEKEAEGNRLVYSDEYGYGNRIKMAEAFSKNNKIYFSGMTPLGGIFDQFMDKIKEEL